MKNSKKVISLSMAAAMLASSATALAAVPMDTVIIGQTAFSLDAMAGDNADAINAEVQAALDAADSDAPIYFDLDGDEIDGFANLEDKTPMTAEQIAALGQITYKDGVNDDKVFESVDGDEVAQTDLTAYKAALAAVTEADYTAASWTEYQKVVTANPVTGANTEAEVKTATDAIIAAQGDLVSVNGLAVESVMAINSTTLELTLKANYSGTVNADKFVVNKKNYASQKLTVSSATLKDATHVTVVLADTTPALKATDYVLVYNGEAAVEFKGDSTKPTFNVEAVDSKTVKVTFSEKIGKTQAEDETNYTITQPATGDKAVLTTASTAKLAEDGKTLTITLGEAGGAGKITTLADSDYYFVIDAAKIADLAGNVIAANSAVTFRGTASDDTTAPTILSANYSEAAKKLTVNFSEPLSTTKLDKTKFTVTDGTTNVQLSAVDVAAWSNGNTTLTLTVSTSEATSIAALGASRTLEVAANGFADAVTTANYNEAVTGISLAQTAIVTGATYNEETNKLALTFNKDIDVSTLELGKIVLSGTGASSVTLTTAGTTVDTTTDGTTIEITLKDTLTNLASWEGASVTNRKVSFTTGTTKDTTGTAVGTTENVAVTYTEDAVKPSLVSAQYNATTKRLTLTFSEKIDYSASTFANLMVTVSGNSYALDTSKLEVTTDAKVYTLKDNTSILASSKNPIDGSKIYYAANAVKDMAANGAVEVKSTGAIDITYIDQTGPTINGTAANNTGLGLNKVKVTFDKKVDKATAEAAANYAISLAANPAVTIGVSSAQMDSSGLFVILTLDANATVEYDYKVVVENIADAYGNVIVKDGTKNVTTWAAASSTDSTGPSLITSGASYKDVDGSKSVTAGDTIKLKYDEPITLGEVVAADFTLAANGGGNTPSLGTNPTFAIGDYSNELVITLGTTPSLVLGANQINSKVTNNIKDAAGNAAAVGVNQVIAKPDTTQPTISTAKYQDANADGTLNAGDYVVLTFNEAMNTGSLGTLDGTADKAFVFAANDVLGDNDMVHDWLSSTELRITLDATPQLDGAENVNGILDSSDATINIGAAPNSALRDLWGNVAKAATSAVKITSDDTVKPTISSVAYTDNNTTGVTAGDYVDVTFSEPVQTVGAMGTDDFYLSNGGSFGDGYTVAPVSGSKTTLRVTLGGAGIGFVPGTTDVNMSATGTINVYDAAGNKATQSASGVVIADNGAAAGDKVAPTISSIESIDDNKDGTTDMVKVTFSEAVLDSSYTKGSITIAGATVGDKATPTSESDTANDNVFYFGITGVTGTGAINNFTTTSAGAFADAAGNQLANSLNTAVTDKAAPVLNDVALTINTATAATIGEATDVITLVFSEPVKTKADYSGNDAVTKAIWDNNFVASDSGVTLLSTSGAMKTGADYNTTPNANIALEFTTNADALLTVANTPVVTTVKTSSAAEFTDAAGNTLVPKTGLTIAID